MHMPKKPVSIRIDPKIHQDAVKAAQTYGMTFSEAMQILAASFAHGSLHIGVMPTRYPPGYIEQLEKEADEADESLRKGKLKTYANADEMFADILGE